MTYSRFLDLKKAEAQAREAQIEASLERIRARALAMHHSDELLDVTNVLREEIAQLDDLELESSVVHLYPEKKNTFQAWYSFHLKGTASDQIVNSFAKIPINSCAWTKEVLIKYLSSENEYTIESKGRKLLGWYRVLDKFLPEVVEHDPKGKMLVPPVLFYNFSKFSGGSLMMVTHEKVSEKTKDLWRRAAAVFDLGYRRFIDLQTAEAQTWEARIETALERVRASSMAMHESQDLGKTATAMFREMDLLGITVLRSGILIFNDNNTMDVWGAASEKKGEIFQIGGVINLRGHPLLEGVHKAWKAKKATWTYHLKGRDLKNYYKTMSISSLNIPDFARLPKEQIASAFYFPEGFLFSFAASVLSDDEGQICQRFAAVFGQAYRRYMDLQKAEVQAREAQIETALERIRSRSMAMHNSDELSALVAVLFDELVKLDVVLARCIIWIIDGQELSARFWQANAEDKTLADSYYIKRIRHPYYNAIIKGWKTKSKRWIYDLKGKEKETIDTILLNETEWINLPKKVKNAIRSSKQTFVSGAFNKFGLDRSLRTSTTYR